MTSPTLPDRHTENHHDLSPPSPWVERFIPYISKDYPVLDLACGGGRHSLLLLRRGLRVTAADRNVSSLAALPLSGQERKSLEILECDLESGSFPLAGRSFGAVVVTNYLHRPLFPALIDLLPPMGLLIYETFALGNAQFGKPSNPDYLLRPGELLDAVAGRLHVLAYEDLIVDEPKPAAVQRICARREDITGS